MAFSCTTKLRPFLKNFLRIFARYLEYMNMKQILENWNRFRNESNEISIDVEGGNIFGVVHTDFTYLNNWGDKQRIDKSILQNIEMPVAIMKNAFVPEEQRGQGIGAQLVEQFINEASDAGASSVILLADLGEIQLEGFDLVKWYEGYGFEIIGKDNAGNPVMELKI